MKPTHMMVVGATQKGKTTYCNELHRRFPKISVFVDTKGIDPLWGVKVRAIAPLRLAAGRKQVWEPPRAAAGLDEAAARSQLLAFWVKIQELAKRAAWVSSRPPWIQLLIDEAQVWESFASDILQDMAARGLGLGLRLVYITQYPAGLKPSLRNNLDTRIVYALGDEGRRCIRNWGWPEDEISAWTAQPYHFASCDPKLGWRHHAPRSTAGADSAIQA